MGMYVLIAGLISWALAFYVARRIGKPYGRAWFWYALFLGWLGVIILLLLGPKNRMRATVVSSEYHVPPAMAGPRGQGNRMYDRR